MRKVFRSIFIIVLASILAAADITAVAYDHARGPWQTAFGAAKVKKAKVTKKDVYRFLRKSLFVGSSITLRRQLYYRKKPKKYMGGVKIAARRGYSVFFDFAMTKSRCIRYRGKPYHLEYIIKKKKKKNVFIQLGTNELYFGVGRSVKNYKKMLRKIRKMNPRVRIFVESTIPNYRDHGKWLTPKTIRRLNRKMKAYVRTQKNMYYLDIFTELSGKSGRLKKKYAEDGIHPNHRGIRKWDSITVRYLKKFIRNERSGIGNEKGKRHRRKAKPATKIKRWNRKRTCLYFNNGTKVRGVAVYKGKLFSFSGKGKLQKKRTAKIRKLAKDGKIAEPLLKLLGEPKKKVYSPSCYGEGGIDGLYRYRHFELYTYIDSGGKEIVQGYYTLY